MGSSSSRPAANPSPTSETQIVRSTAKIGDPGEGDGNIYELFGFALYSNPEPHEIQRAYWKLCHKYHPDHHVGTDEEQKAARTGAMKIINAAKAEFDSWRSNRKAKQRYDDALRARLLSAGRKEESWGSRIWRWTKKCCMVAAGVTLNIAGIVLTPFSLGTSLALTGVGTAMVVGAVGGMLQIGWEDAQNRLLKNYEALLLKHMRQQWGLKLALGMPRSLYLCNFDRKKRKTENFDLYICATAAAWIYKGGVDLKQMLAELLQTNGCVVKFFFFDDGKRHPNNKVDTYPPFAVIIFGRKGEPSTLLAVWRGSISVMDWAMNLAAAPVSCPMWNKKWPSIQAHAGWQSLVYDRFHQVVMNGPMMDEVRKCNVTKFLFSGHSLGGALAQIALLGAMAMKDQSEELNAIDMKAFVFASPMPFSVKVEPGLQFQSLFRKSCYNMTYEMDIVPHLPGHRKWLKEAMPFLKELGEEQVLQVVPGLQFVNGAKNAADALIDSIIPDWASNIADEMTRNWDYLQMATIVQVELEMTADKRSLKEFSARELEEGEFIAQGFPCPRKPWSIFKHVQGKAHQCLPYAMAFKPP